MGIVVLAVHAGGTAADAGREALQIARRLRWHPLTDRHQLLNQGILASIGPHMLGGPPHRPAKGRVVGVISPLDAPDFASALLSGGARSLAAFGACLLGSCHDVSLPLAALFASRVAITPNGQRHKLRFRHLNRRFQP